MTLRRLLIGIALVAVATTAVATAAWVSTPPTARLAERVQLHVTGAPVAPGGVAPVLIRALVATEDERFYRHDGVDVVGLARAVPYDVVHASLAQGASTITEQVAKLLYLKGNDHTPWRKLEDMALAVKLERRYSKSQILMAYLNTAYFGSGAYGVRAASRRYFGVEPRALTLAQASLLAGLPQAPSAYDPILHAAAARTRQEDVLRSLVRVGAISSARADAVVAQPLSLRGHGRLPTVTADLAPGPSLAWRDAAAGALLLLFGVMVVALRRRFRGRPLRLASSAFAFIVLLGGVGVLIRSVRTF